MDIFEILFRSVQVLFKATHSNVYCRYKLSLLMPRTQLSHIEGKVSRLVHIWHRLQSKIELNQALFGFLRSREKTVLFRSSSFLVSVRFYHPLTYAYRYWIIQQKWQQFGDLIESFSPRPHIMHPSMLQNLLQ